MALKTLKRGCRWDFIQKAILWKAEDQEEDIRNGVSEEKVTMVTLAAMAGSILECLNFTWDSPELHGGEGMPVLDTSMWMDEEQREAGIPQDAVVNEKLITAKTGKLAKVILFKFYRKPMAEKISNLQSSASPEGQKVVTATQECIRRLKNTSRDLPPEVVEEILRTYMLELEAGGYGHKWRMNILEAAIGGYEKMLQGELEGRGRVNRPERSTRGLRRWKRLVGRSTWFQPPGSKAEKRGVKRRLNDSVRLNIEEKF